MQLLQSRDLLDETLKPASAVEFEQLVAEYYQPLYRFALSLSQREADASDLTQQTFLRWATRGFQLRERSKAKSWLFTTLYREFLSGQRRTVRFPHVEIGDAEAELPTVDPRSVESMDSRSALDALQNLDLPVIMATVMYASFFVVMANALVDVVYILLDPRVRTA